MVCLDIPLYFFFVVLLFDFVRVQFTTKSDKFFNYHSRCFIFHFSNYLSIFIKKEHTIFLDNHYYQVVPYLLINLHKRHQF